MTAIDRYIKAKAEYQLAEAFVSMFAEQGNKVVDTVFYCSNRPQNGNPTAMPMALRTASEKDASKKADNICVTALAVMATELQAIAEEARAEYAQIAADAGVTLP